MLHETAGRDRVEESEFHHAAILYCLENLHSFCYCSLCGLFVYSATIPLFGICIHCDIEVLKELICILLIFPLCNLYSRFSILYSVFSHLQMYNYSPTSFTGVLATNDDRQLDITLRNNNQYSIPNPRIEQFKKSSLYSLPKEWNELNDIKL
jgi:hypothetical protein